MADHCLQCNKELQHVAGKKKKKYCDDVCKRTYWNARKGHKNITMPLLQWEQALESLRLLKETIKRLQRTDPAAVNSPVDTQATDQPVTRKQLDQGQAPDPTTNRTEYMKWLRNKM